MQKYSFWGYETVIDKEATLEWYAGSAGWGCECGHCRNFLALARNRQLPASVLDVLDDLGIPPEKATYVGELYADDEGVHYQFSYRLAGTILSEASEEQVRAFNAGCCCHEPYPYGAPGFPQPHFDLEFWITLPWILDEPLGG